MSRKSKDGLFIVCLAKYLRSMSASMHSFDKPTTVPFEPFTAFIDLGVVASKITIGGSMLPVAVHERTAVTQHSSDLVVLTLTVFGTKCPHGFCVSAS